jgi:flagellar biogenesis protein FliO
VSSTFDSSPVTYNADDYEVIDGYELKENKGIYLIKINNKYLCLMGINNEKFYFLKQFNTDNIPLMVRKKDNEHVYVACGKWKAIIHLGEEYIKTVKEINIS